LIAWLLPCLAVAAGVGILAADRGWLSVACASGIAAVSTGAALAARRHPRVVAGCAVIVVAALGAARHAESLALAARHAPQTSFDALADGSVRAVRRETRWIGLELHDVVAVQFGALERPVLPSRLRLTESRETPEGVWLAGLVEGDRIRARLRLRPSGGLRNPGTRERSRDTRRRGIAGEARLVDARLAMKLRGSASPGIRDRLARRLFATGSGGALLAALALGDRSGVDPEAREAFRRLGISHLLAVSGLHLVLVATLGFAAVRRIAVRIPCLAEASDVRVWAFAGAGLAAVGYAMLAGWGVPVRRAMVLLLVSLVALGLRRRAPPLHALSAAALWIVIVDPSAMFALGSQLSFIATAALLWDPRPAGVGWRRGLRVSATVIAATAPVLAAHGVGSTPMGLVANLVAVPWTGCVLLPASLVATGLAMLEPSAALDGALAACAWLGQVSHEIAVAAGQGLPAPLPPRSGWVGVAVGVGIAVASVRAQKTLVRVLLAVLVSGGMWLLPSLSVGPGPPRVVAFDVGLGDAILVEGRGTAILVDAGWGTPRGVDLGRSVVLPALQALGVEHLDVLVASHADLDHSGGLAALLEALPVDEVWLPAGRLDEFDSLLAVAARRNVVVREKSARVGTSRVGEFDVEILWPPAEANGRGRNDSSLVLRVEVEGTRILLTGDIGRAAERALLASGVDLGADVLKLPHHGSRGSGTRAFLEAVGPEVALLSASCSTRSRLPTSEVFDRAERVGMSLWWTGRDGALWVQLRKGPVRRVVWGWQSDPNCRPPASRPAPRRT
jgi:competence protein ComEC